MEKKEMEKKEAAPAAADKKDDGAGHADVASDKELMGKMLKKHLGEEPTEEVMSHANEAYQALCKGGASHEEACETAAHAMKAAKAMHMCKEDEAKDEGKEKKEDESKKEASFDDKGLNSSGDDKGEQPKASFGDKGLNESAEVLKLKGEVAALREAAKKRELVDYVDNKLASTKIARASTKVIKESLLACRSEAEVDQKMAIYLEGYKHGAEGSDDMAWIVGAEKTTNVEKAAGDSFADCVHN